MTDEVEAPMTEPSISERLRRTQLYEGSGEESDLPEQAADEIERQTARADKAEGERREIMTARTEAEASKEFWLAAEGEAVRRATAAEQRLAEVEGALRDATANLCGAASAYRKHAARHRSVGQATADPLFTTRAMDFEKAADRACAALVALYPTAGAQRGETEG